MTELTPYRPNDPAAELVAWGQAAESAFRLAGSLVKTNVCPPTFRGKPEEATAVILLGAELGLTPIAALRSMFEIRGTLGMYVRAQVALVQSRGHRIWTVSESDDAVTVAGHRRDDPDHVEKVTWTIARARQAGFIRRGARGEPSQYELQPRSMLWARAAGDVARRVAADVLAGVPEGDDPGDSVTGVTGVTNAPTRVVQRRPVERPEIEPAIAPPAPPDDAAADQEPTAHAAAPQETLPPDEPPPDDGDGDDGEPLITPAQLRRVQVMFVQAGIRGSTARHDWLSRELGRQIDSTNDITVTEASLVIDALEGIQGRDDRG
jgi:hypothetical protein